MRRLQDTGGRALKPRVCLGDVVAGQTPGRCTNMHARSGTPHIATDRIARDLHPARIPFDPHPRSASLRIAVTNSLRSQSTLRARRIQTLSLLLHSAPPGGFRISVERGQYHCLYTPRRNGRRRAPAQYTQAGRSLSRRRHDPNRGSLPVFVCVYLCYLRLSIGVICGSRRHQWLRSAICG